MNRKIDYSNLEKILKQKISPLQQKYQQYLNNGDILQLESKFQFFDYFKIQNVPVKYISFLNRLLNARLYPKPKIRKIINYSGRGTLQSMASQMLLLCNLFLSQKQFELWYNDFQKFLQSNLTQTIIDKEWLESIRQCRTAINIYTQHHKKTLINGFWDIPKQLTAIFIGYQFSPTADIFCLCEKQQLLQISLKKGKQANLLNTTLRSLKMQKQQLSYKKYLQKQTDIYKKYLNDIPIEEFQKMFEEDLQWVKLQALKNSKNKRTVFSNTEINNIFQDCGKNRHTRHLLLLFFQNKKKELYQLLFQQLSNLTKQYCDRIIYQIHSNIQFRTILLNNFKQQFPLKQILQKKQILIIGELIVDNLVLEYLFDTNNWDNVVETLQIQKQCNISYLVYSNITLKKKTRICKIVIREDGIGYGYIIRLDCQLCKQFVSQLQDINSIIYHNKGENDK